jgi:hypothetical protein
MVLVDTSVWVAHFREGDSHLKELLERGRVACHPFVIGELACGSLHNRKEILSLMEALPPAVMATHDEVMKLVENHRLMGVGLGYIDVHLLASALLTPAQIWTNDMSLRSIASELNIAYMHS